MNSTASTLEDKLMKTVKDFAKSKEKGYTIHELPVSDSSEKLLKIKIIERRNKDGADVLVDFVARLDYNRNSCIMQTRNVKEEHHPICREFLAYSKLVREVGTMYYVFQ